MFSWFKYIFSIDTKSSNRVIIYLFGIKISHIKPGIRQSKSMYEKYSVAEIPKATGVLRLTQLGDLKMMKIFDKICADNGLEYWLDFGNLLGAVRHKGFIPWDDDADVGMLRDDYEKFIILFKDGFAQYPDLYLNLHNNGRNRCFVKVLHRKFPNLAIDIFPYDFYYEKIDDNKKKELTNKIKKISNSKINRLLTIFYINRPNAIRKRFKRDTEKKILKFHKTDRLSEPAIFYGIDYPHKHDNLFFDYNTLFPLKKILFEDYEFPCPYDYESYLKQVYGNYMELPDVIYPLHTNSEDINYSEQLKEYINE